MIISIEGIDGSGKSTQAKLLLDAINNSGVQAVLFREPGGTETGETIRSILKHGGEHLSPETQLLLFSAARRHLLETRVVPALEKKMVVILDRFIDSTYAYQGAMGLDAGTIKAVNSLVLDGDEYAPDLTILLDIPDEVAKKRRAGRLSGEPEGDRFESVGDEEAAVRRSIYRSLAEANPTRFVVIDASGSAEDVAVQVRKAIMQHAYREHRGSEHSLLPRSGEVINPPQPVKLATSFTRVCRMNEAYGNPNGGRSPINFERLTNQCKNIGDEFKELMDAIAAKDELGIRDALSDILVFTYGAYHFIGADADEDMLEIDRSNMSKFISNDEEKEATTVKYEGLGMVAGIHFSFDGDYPVMRCRCLVDFVDENGNEYRPGKVLKPVGYSKPSLKPIKRDEPS